jgi:HSF-type DNA-binding
MATSTQSKRKNWQATDPTRNFISFLHIHVTVNPCADASSNESEVEQKVSLVQSSKAIKPDPHRNVYAAPYSVKMNSTMLAQNVDGNFSHLMEAATALARLTGSAAPSAASAEAKVCVHTNDDATGANKIAPSSSGSNNINGKEIFPQRLMMILDDPTLSDIVTWLPHGRSFVIVRPDVFTDQVLPKYLPPVDARSSTKYPSFTRKLNRWGFRQATRGPDTGAFHHPLFRRDQPHLCLEMVCQRSRDRSSSSKGGGGTTRQQKNLPAKKRHVLLTKETLDMMNSQAPTTTGVPHSASSPSTTEEGHEDLFQQRHATVSVTDSDSQSMRSSVLTPAAADGTSSTASSLAAAATALFGAFVATAMQKPPQASPVSMNGSCIGAITIPQPPRITTDAALAQRAIAERNEQERLRVAKAMLYHAYLQAIQGGSVSGN